MLWRIDQASRFHCFSLIYLFLLLAFFSFSAIMLLLHFLYCIKILPKTWFYILFKWFQILRTGIINAVKLLTESEKSPNNLLKSKSVYSINDLPSFLKALNHIHWLTVSCCPNVNTECSSYSHKSLPLEPFMQSPTVCRNRVCAIVIVEY